MEVKPWQIKARLSVFDDLFGGLFDFDGDGTTDIAEEVMGYAILEDMTEDDEEYSDGDDFDF